MISIGAWLCAIVTRHKNISCFPCQNSLRTEAFPDIPISSPYLARGSKCHSLFLCAQGLWKITTRKLKSFQMTLTVKFFVLSIGCLQISSDRTQFKWSFLVRKTRHPPVTRSFSRRPRLHFPVDLSSAQHHTHSPPPNRSFPTATL